MNAAELDPIRADEEKIGGAIHKPMFERLMLCNYAIADITGANPNVYYELGIRHAMRPRSTVILFAAGTTLPFDIALLRGIPYQTNEQGIPSESRRLRGCDRQAAWRGEGESARRQSAVSDARLHAASRGRSHQDRHVPRPLQLFEAVQGPLANALQQGEQAVKETVADPAFKNLHDLETGVVVDMFLTLRDVKAHKEMIDLYQRMPEPLQRARIVREQYGFALNREGRAQDATAVLKAVIEEFGPSSETNGLLGRVYKDQWDAAKKSGAGALQVRGLLKLAAETYLAGFQADWRDAYPGVNAVTLMELMDTPPPIQAEILPVVRFSAAQKAKASGDYWDFATLMELAVLARDENAAMEHAEIALTKAQFGWHLETTERQLRLIRETRAARGEQSLDQGSEDALAEKRAQMARRRRRDFEIVRRRIAARLIAKGAFDEASIPRLLVCNDGDGALHKPASSTTRPERR